MEKLRELEIRIDREIERLVKCTEVLNTVAVAEFNEFNKATVDVINSSIEKLEKISEEVGAHGKNLT